MSKNNVLGYEKPAPLNKTSILNFGQYKGESLGEVIKYDASYLLWAIEKEIIDVEPFLYDEICELENEQDVYGDYWAAQHPDRPFSDDLY